MTNQTAPDTTNHDRRLAREWAESIKSTTNSDEPTENPWSDRALAAARVILNDLPAPPLPGGWRLADHQKHGRVMVTSPAPDRDGDLWGFRSDDTRMGSERIWCKPDELTFIDTDQEADDD